MRTSILSIILFLATTISAQVKLVGQPGGKTTFPLYSNNQKTTLYYDKNDFEAIKTTTSLFADDIERVTGNRPLLTNSSSELKDYTVIIGTIGKNALIDELIKEKKFDANPIQGQWERYIIQTIDQPFSGVKKALVIAGSDRRGTSYGVFSISEAIGVSPWYYWADVPVKKRNTLHIEAPLFVSQTPSIKYRGIFLNDEGWGLTPWAAKTDDPQLNDIGPETYAKICELLLRLKGNMLAPAMHPGSGSFNKYPENKIVADSYGIIMTSSHCEPLLFNNVSEWDSKTMGDWNYKTNKAGINKILEKRVSENAHYENVYTIAMRGIHDAGIVGVSKEEQCAMLEEVMKDQRNILGKYISKPIEEIPQVFVPYKEVLDIYEKGLKVPGDITIVWPDDNFGYLKRLSNKNEQKRSGGSGVYYHISYLGEPHDYLWLNTTPPAFMFEELSKAYSFGADRYWLLNVGDIKPGELGIQLFMDMAWNINQFNFGNINQYQVNFLASVFGEKYKKDIEDILSSYYHLAFERKPEAMGWGIEWNNEHMGEIITDTDFSLTNYNEAENRMAEYDRIANKAGRIWKSLPEEYKAACYELLFYPVKGAALMNKKMLTAQMNRWYAHQGRAATNLMAEKTKAYQDSIQQITETYNSLLNGKWNHMMSVPPGWVATYQDMPPVTTIDVPQEANPGLFLSNEDCTFGVSNIHTLPCFNPFTKKEYFVEIYNKGSKTFKWEAIAKQPWIKLNKKSGQISTQERIIVSIDWINAPVGERITGEIEIAMAGKKETVFVSLFNPATPTVSELNGMYVEDNGYVSINAGQFQRKNENKDIQIEVINGLGYENQAVQLGKAGAPAQEVWFKRTPKAEYDFYAFNAGSATVYTYALPLFSIDKEHNTRYGVTLDDDGTIQFPVTASPEYSSPWKMNVIRNAAISSVPVYIDKPGKHTLKIMCADPGMVIHKIVIDLGGMKRSYLGPETTLVK